MKRRRHTMEFWWVSLWERRNTHHLFPKGWGSARKANLSDLSCVSWVTVAIKLLEEQATSTTPRTSDDWPPTLNHLALHMAYPSTPSLYFSRATLSPEPRFLSHILSSLFYFVHSFFRKETVNPSDRKLSVFIFLSPFLTPPLCLIKKASPPRSVRVMSIHVFLLLLLLLFGLSETNSCRVVLAKLEQVS